MTEEKKEAKKRSIDPATIEILGKMEAEGISNVFVRAENTKPCPIGQFRGLL